MQSSRIDLTQPHQIPSSKHLIPSLQKKQSKEKAKLRLTARNFLLENISLRAQHCLSQIEDPLWKRLCYELEKMVGTFAILKIWNCQLGSFSSRDSILDLYCPTEEAVDFAQQYAFVILGALQQYFPVLRQLNVNLTRVM